ncbi:MAG: hypothetical protein JW870_11185 [Candidatus Delongbacteria bacterium]|nr:hypothetical protein [Candidatus Delongbacteria bacterium]
MISELEEKKLSELEIFSTEDIQFLVNYNIHTVGQLLGATKGLINKSLFGMMSDGEEKLHRFITMLPFEMIKLHRELEKDHSMGLWEEEEDGDGDDE